MAYKTIEQLLDEIYAEITKKKYVKSVSVKIEGPILKCRIYLNNSFISVFFNEETKITAFTLIKENRRAFGIDKDSLRGMAQTPNRQTQRSSTVPRNKIQTIFATN